MKQAQQLPADSMPQLSAMPSTWQHPAYARVHLVRLSSHTIALCSGLPVVRLHSTVVSRWLVMPSAFTATGRPSFACGCCVFVTGLVQLVIENQRFHGHRPPELRLCVRGLCSV